MAVANPRTAQTSDLIEPATLAAISDLEVAGRMLATGYLFGRHLGQRHGPGHEFAQYRAWQPGDSSRSIDWRLYARSERLHVRESELETDQRIWLLLDTSASMDFASPGGATNKFDFARKLAAALGYLAQVQGDQLGLMTLGARCQVAVPASAGRLQWYRVLAAMHDLRCEGSVGRGSDAAPVDESLRLPASFTRYAEGSLIFVLSDFYQQGSEFVHLMERLGVGQQDVRALCLETHAERTLDYPGVVRLMDLESGEQVLTSPSRAARTYQQARETYLQDLTGAFNGRGVDLARLNVDEPLDARLRRYLTEGLC